MRRAATLAAALLAALATVATSAHAAVPRSFFGVVADGPALNGSRVGGEMRLMRRSGVGTVRIAIPWSVVEPRRGALRLGPTDRTVRAAARAGIDVLPVVVSTPAWAREAPLDGASPPRDPADYAGFLRALVARYGPRGTLWRGERRLPRRPVRRWQVWNEPDLRAAWSSPEPWATGYVRLLRAAHAAIKGADPRAVVILSGLTNASWLDLREVYRAGGRGLFDVAAVHPFTATVDNVVRIVRLARDEMRAAGDARTPLMVTEMTWTSAGARARPRFGWETDERGQAARLRDALVRLAALRARERLAGAFWYTWMSPRIGSPDTFHYAGLRRLGRDGSPVSKPALAAFRAVVRRLTR